MSAYRRFGGGFPAWLAAAALTVWVAACGDTGTSGKGGGGNGGNTTSSSTGGSTSTGGGGGGGAGGGCGDVTQTPGDCMKNICKDGSIQAVIDDTDLPEDGVDCTKDECVNGVVLHQPQSEGTTCNQDGGKVCDGKGECVPCVTTTDCQMGEICTAAHECKTGDCNDGVKDNDETDVDCGGMACGATCQPGQSCMSGTDCIQGVCKQGVCLVPTCGDGVQNGTETDVDCGGSCATGFNPKKCGPDQGCTVDADCVGGECNGTTCVPNCNDKVKNNEEAGVDCGGPNCAGCTNGKDCTADGDCSSGHCAANICCTTACDGACESCTAAGKGAGVDGICGPAKAGTLCGPPPSCVNGVETTQGACDGASVCVGAISQSCSPYICDVNNTCKSSCADDNECSAPATCVTGVCQLPAGVTCATGAECASGFCADGFCCDAACTGACKACSNAKKGSGVDGVCGDILTGTDPDNECSGLLNCGAGKCQLGLGAACAADADCGSGHCADGVCCNSACGGTCQACTAAKKGSGSDGTCGNIPNNQDPDDECSGTSTCNGQGQCSLGGNGSACVTAVDCVSGFCVDGFCCNSACSGLCQACSTAKKGSGSNGLCGPIAAGSDPDDECMGTLVCSASGCKSPNGEACVSGASCLNAFCVDGVCCDTACSGTCQACTSTKKGSGADGACGNIAANSDPDNECGGATTCSGAGSCALLPIGTACALGVECASGFCADGVCCDTACTATCNACTAAKKGSGQTGTCGPIAAGTDPDSECAGAASCNGASACALLALGASCAVSSECSSGFCADGVCCNTACTTSCQACTAVKKGQGFDGTCGSILIGTDPDNECAGNANCNGVSACALLANGQPCAQGGECTSGFCADGVCCNAVCNTSCQACTAAKRGTGADGTCGSISSGLDPDNECTGTQVCNGANACKQVNGDSCSAATDCLSGFCVDGVCCNTGCTGTCQACTAAKKGNGADGTCSNIVASTDPDSECGGAANCNGAGACGLFALGAACAVNGECASGFCADGVCCNSACNTTCNACTAVKKGTGTDGTCGTIVSGLDPDNECSGSSFCNGSGACKFPTGDACAQATDCLSGNCVDGVCCNTTCTGVCQACTATKKGSGADGTCGNIAVATDPDSECFSTYSCNGSGACALLTNGTACMANGECASGFCADGVCCNSACNALCNACTALKKGTGADGTCGNVGTGTDPDSECPGSQVCNASAQCKANLGDACLLGTDCSSGFCADGVCCSAACTGTCQACTAVKKGSGADGVCGSIAGATDPDNECFGAISCNGAGACGLIANGGACSNNSECSSAFCVDGVCCNTACNTLCNACTAVKKGSGTDGTCGVIANFTDPDNECAGTQVCNGASACKAQIADACLQNADCASGFCADGVCCNTACNTACVACTAMKKGSGADGTCGNIAISTDPDNECFGAITCNGAGACGTFTPGTACAANGECASGFCVDGVCCNTACNTLCNACTAAKKGSGTDGTCGVIGSGLDPDSECAANQVCNGSSACKIPQGDACVLGTDCLSGACVDGVCCNTTCTGACQACTAAKKGGGTDGTCGSIAVGSDPDNECFGAITCNGAGACGTLVAGSACAANGECASGFCVDGVCCNTACNTLCQACTAVKKGSGTDGTCGVIIGGVDPDDECAGALVCSGASTCKAATGDACLVGADCVSGFCADGVCCNAACTGACQACTAAKKGSGSNGVCGSIGLGLDPDNECGGAATCNGAAACGLFTNGTACAINGECASGFCVDGVCCNTVCNTLCNACTAVKKGSGADGTCGVIASGQDPDNECGGAASCNGASACALFANGTACSINGECTSGNCVDGFCCNTACNGSCQACSTAKKGSGANGTCGVVATNTDPDNECPGSTSCTAVQTCSLFVNGQTCSINAECQSGSCVDGVCCNVACDGLCQACVGVKTGVSDGTCADVVIGTDPDNECSDLTSSPNCGGNLTCGP